MFPENPDELLDIIANPKHYAKNKIQALGHLTKFSDHKEPASFELLSIAQEKQGIYTLFQNYFNCQLLPAKAG